MGALCLLVLTEEILGRTECSGDVAGADASLLDLLAHLEQRRTRLGVLALLTEALDPTQTMQGLFAFRV